MRFWVGNIIWGVGPYAGLAILAPDRVHSWMGVFAAAVMIAICQVGECIVYWRHTKPRL